MFRYVENIRLDFLGAWRRPLSHLRLWQEKPVMKGEVAETDKDMVNRPLPLCHNKKPLNDSLL